MAGFSTLREDKGFHSFGRMVFSIFDFFRLAVGSYDWVGSLFSQSTIVGSTAVWNSPDVWDGAGDYNRAPNTINYKLNCVPYVDTSGDNPQLKLAHCGHTGDAADDFQEVETGIKAKAGNNELVILTQTGVEFSGGELEDGNHYLRWKHKHEAKSDTHFTNTAVLRCESNVLYAYVHWQSHGSLQSGNYVDAATAISSGYLYWQITWDPDANTWTVDQNDQWWQGNNSASSVNITTSGGKIGKGTTAYNITGSDPADGRMWEIEVG